MKTILGLFFGLMMVIFFSSMNVSAQVNRGGINNREHRERQAIRRGIHSGELNRREAARLVNEQRQIERLEQRLRASGDGLSPRERARLERELNEARRHIYRQTHDGQNRPL
ncbi:MAG: hypothetical protein ACRD6X_21580 [Pyrinomonadaceae bacterium]